MPSKAGTWLGLGTVTTYLSLIVLIPLAAVAYTSAKEGPDTFWSTLSNPQVFAALKFTFLMAVVVMVANVIFGTLIAWVLVRDNFWGKRIVDSLIDLPFALPTIVAGLTLLALYGPKSPFGINIAYAWVGVLAALAFVTFPFVVRAVQPVVMEMDTDMEKAAWSLGAGKFKTFRLVILPNLWPAIITGAALSFAKALGEFGSVVLISGNIPFKTEVASVNIYGQIQSDNLAGAAAESMILLVAALLVIALLNILQRRASHYEG